MLEDRSMTRLVACMLGVLVAGLGVVASPAAAEQTTLGVAAPTTTGSGESCGPDSPCTLAQTTLASGLAAAPAAGRITSWSAVSSFGGTAHLRVLRRAPAVPPERKFAALATSSQQTLGTTATPFPTDLPIGPGNLIGLTMAPNSAVDDQSNASSTFDHFGDAFADGTSEDSLAQTHATLELGAQFFYTPVVSGVAASSGSTAGGEAVVISGDHLTDSTAVHFGSTSATTFTINSNTQITAKAPAASAATVDVTVGGPGGTSAPSSADHYSFVAPTATVGPAVLDFGDQLDGSTSSVRAITLTNTGTVPVAIGAVTMSGAATADYTELSDGCAGHAVAAAASCSVSLVFTPSTSGVRNATLHVSDNASDGPHTVILTGTGTGTGTATGTGTTSPPKPSNAFTLAKPRLNKNNGTATLVATIPGSGELVLHGTGLGALTKAANGAGKVTLTVKPAKQTNRRLNRTGKANITARVTYTPTGGDPRTQSKKLTLRLTRRQRKRPRLPRP
jgi:hypothetical protein